MIQESKIAFYALRTAQVSIALLAILALGGSIDLVVISAHPEPKTFGNLVLLLILSVWVYSATRRTIPELVPIPREGRSETACPVKRLIAAGVCFALGLLIYQSLQQNNLRTTYQVERLSGNPPAKTVNWPSLFHDPVGMRAFVPEAKAFRAEAAGNLFIPVAGEYRFNMVHDGVCTLWLEGQERLSFGNTWEVVSQEFEAALTRGWHPVRLVFWDGEVSSRLRLCWEDTTFPVSSIFFTGRDAPSNIYGYVRLFLAGAMVLFVLAGMILIIHTVIDSDVRWHYRFAVGILVLGGLYRLWICHRTGWYLNGDETMFIAMARDIREGVNLPIFYSGQDYMGNLVSYALAPLVNGPGDARVWYRLWQVALCTGSALIWTWWLHRYIGSIGALIWAALFSLGNANIINLSIAYAPNSALVLGALLVVAGTKLALGEGKASFWWKVWGLSAGLAYWINSQLLPFVAAGFLVALSGLFRKKWSGKVMFKSGGIAFIVGASPVLVYDLFHKGAAWKTMTGFGSESMGLGGIFRAIQYPLFASGYSVILGGRFRWANYDEICPHPLAILLYFTMLAALVGFIHYCAYRFRKKQGSIPMIMVGGVSLAFLMATASSRFAMSLPPRYLYLAIAPTFALLATGFEYWYRRGRIWSWCVGIAVSLIVLWNVYTVSSFPLMTLAIPSHFSQLGVYPDGDNKETLEFLEQEEIEAIGGEHWITMPIAAQTGFRLPCHSPLEEELMRRFLSSRTRAWVVHPNDLFTMDCPTLFERVFGEHEFVGAYQVHYDEHPWPDMTSWSAEGFDNQEEAWKAIDGDIIYQRAWNALVPQAEGQFFAVDFHRPLEVSQVVVFRGRAGFPRWEEAVKQVPQLLELHYLSKGEWKYYGEMQPELNDGIHWIRLDPQIESQSIKLTIKTPAEGVHWAISELFIR